ncbi:MAG: SH3 domain-containing protein, partial [Zoogloeaceae bacterium]|nr:SH3 domain-containing protein [Zoogloeaceae bacterium]
MVPRKILLPLFTAACFSGGAMAQENARFVHGSYVNVRENAAPDSAVVDHVTTNTPVEVLAQADKRCQIRYGADKTGFVPCNLLGNRKLTLAEVGQKWIADPDPAKGNVDNPAYSPPRAFWISPSADGLLSAGEHFERTLLSKAQYELEHGVDPQGRWLMFDALDQDGPRDSEYEALHYIPKLLRYPVPEFEAMKAVLENGIVVAPDNPERWMSCAELEQAREAHYQKWPPIKPETIGWYRLLNPHDLAYAHIEFCKTHDCRNPDLRPLIEQCTVFGLELPKIKPSFFKSTPAILPGDPGVEAISSAFGLKEY